MNMHVVEEFVGKRPHLKPVDAVRHNGVDSVRMHAVVDEHSISPMSLANDIRCIVVQMHSVTVHGMLDTQHTHKVCARVRIVSLPCLACRLSICSTTVTACHLGQLYSSIVCRHECTVTAQLL